MSGLHNVRFKVRSMQIQQLVILIGSRVLGVGKDIIVPLPLLLLNMSTKYKLMLGIKDLLAILYYYWCVAIHSLGATSDLNGSFHSFLT